MSARPRTGTTFLSAQLEFIHPLLPPPSPRLASKGACEAIVDFRLWLELYDDVQHPSVCENSTRLDSTRSRRCCTPAALGLASSHARLTSPCVELQGGMMDPDEKRTRRGEDLACEASCAFSFFLSSTILSSSTQLHPLTTAAPITSQYCHVRHLTACAIEAAVDNFVSPPRMAVPRSVSAHHRIHGLGPPS